MEDDARKGTLERMQKEEVSGDSLFLIHDFFTDEECRRSIEFSEGQVYEDAPISTRGGEVLAKAVRNNMRVMVDSTALADRLFERAKPFLPPRVDYWHLHGMNERFR